MMRVGALAAAALLAGGCAALDENDRLRFCSFAAVRAQNQFRFVARADAIYPLAGEGEAQRLKWLARYLADAHYCVNGFDITERTVGLKRRALVANAYDVFYAGKCR